MAISINFSGIGFEVGQGKHGLMQSSEHVRLYFPVLQKIGFQMVDCGDVQGQDSDLQIKVFSNEDLKQIEFTNYRNAYRKSIRLLRDKKPLLNWGGDHSIAISTVGAFVSTYPEGYVLWIDAHADLNLPEKSLTGNFHGMPLSVLFNIDDIANNKFKWLTKKLNPQKLIYLGLRDLDPWELGAIKSLKIKSYFYQDILKIGIRNVATEILTLTKQRPMHISFDIDSMDPLYAPSTGVPVPGGFTPKDIDALSEYLFRYSDVRSLDIVEVNPFLGTFSHVEQTFLMAFKLLIAVFNNNHGGLYDCLGKRNQRKHSSQMEPCLQV